MTEYISVSRLKSLRWVERPCVWQFWQVSYLAPLLILSRPILGTNPRQLNVAIIAFTFYKWARKSFQLQLSRTGENTLQSRRLEIIRCKYKYLGQYGSNSRCARLLGFAFWNRTNNTNRKVLATNKKEQKKSFGGSAS